MKYPVLLLFVAVLIVSGCGATGPIDDKPVGDDPQLEPVGDCPRYMGNWAETRRDYGVSANLPSIVKDSLNIGASVESNYMRLRPEIKVLDAAQYLAAFYCQQHHNGDLSDPFYEAYVGRLMDFIEQHIGDDNLLEELAEPNIDVKDEPTDDQDSQGNLVPYRLLLDGSGSSGAGGIVRYAWTIDGTSVSDDLAFDHVFCEPGQYQVTLTVEGSNGQTGRTSTNVTAEEWRWSDMRVVLMDNYDEANRYEGIGEGETNSYEILRVMDLEGMGLGSGPCTQVYAVKQRQEDQYQQLRNIRELDPDVIILHRSAFPEGSDQAQETALRDFLRSMAHTDTHFVVYSRGMRDEQDAKAFKQEYSDVLAGRLHVIPIRNRNLHFKDDQTKRLAAQIIKTVLQEAAKSKTDRAKSACPEA
jgi:PKD repeat protein